MEWQVVADSGERQSLTARHAAAAPASARRQASAGHLAKAAVKFAARHEEAQPTSILAVATTRAEALRVVFKGTRMPGTETNHVHAVVMTRRFASYRSGMHARPPHEYLPHIGSALAVVLDAETLDSLDVRLGDQDDPALLHKLGPVTTLKGA